MRQIDDRQFCELKLRQLLDELHRRHRRVDRCDGEFVETKARHELGRVRYTYRCDACRTPGHVVVTLPGA